MVGYLGEKDPYDQPPSPTTSQQDTPHPWDKTSEEEPIEGEGEPMEGNDPEGDASGVRNNL